MRFSSSLLSLAFWLAFASLLQAAPPLKVVTLSTILTEIASQVGGDKVEVTGLLQPGMDPHEFQPTPGDLTAIADAQLILASGKHLEGYLAKLPQSSGSQGVMVEVGASIPSLQLKPEAGEEAAGSLVEDPHWWHSIANVKLAVDVVRDELIKISPTDRPAFQQNAAEYQARLDALQKWARLKIAELPRNQRKLVTTHDAFQYFAHDYGFTIFAIEGVSTDDEPSNQKVIAIIQLIKSQQVPAIFAEFAANPKVTDVITRETGVKIAGTLYADGLGPNEAATYEGMMRHNITTIVGALAKR